MSGSFAAAMDTLERGPGDPQLFCDAFLEVFPVSGASVATIGDVLGTRDAGGERRAGGPARRTAVRPRRGSVLGRDALARSRCSPPTSAVPSRLDGPHSRSRCGARRSVRSSRSPWSSDPSASAPSTCTPRARSGWTTPRPSRRVRWPPSSAGTCSGGRSPRSAATSRGRQRVLPQAHPPGIRDGARSARRVAPMTPASSSRDTPSRPDGR